MAAAIVENAKTQRPSVCNAAETLLVHRNVAATFLNELAPRLEGVELVGDDATQQILGDRVAGLATDDDYATEFLDLKLAVRVVDTLDAAIAHITRYGTGHSEAIVTNDLRAAERFVQGGRRRRRARQRLHPLRRRRGAGLRGRDRDLHPEAPRPWPDGPA